MQGQQKEINGKAKAYESRQDIILEVEENENRNNKFKKNAN